MDEGIRCIRLTLNLICTLAPFKSFVPPLFHNQCSLMVGPTKQPAPQVVNISIHQRAKVLQMPALSNPPLTTYAQADPRRGRD